MLQRLNSPLLFGEWSLATQFGTSDSFRTKWADAQKMAYSKGAGWIVSAILTISDIQITDSSFLSFG